MADKPVIHKGLTSKMGFSKEQFLPEPSSISFYKTSQTRTVKVLSYADELTIISLYPDTTHATTNMRDYVTISRVAYSKENVYIPTEIHCHHLDHTDTIPT